MNFRSACIKLNIIHLSVAFLSLGMLILLTIMDETTFIPAYQSIFLIAWMSTIGVALSITFILKQSFKSVQICLLDLALAGAIGFFMINSLVLQESTALSFRLNDLIGLVMFYGIIRMTVFKYFWLLMIFLVLGALTQVIYGELQMYEVYPSLHRRFPVTGTFFNPGPYAGYLATVFPAALGLYLYADRWKKIQLPWVILLVNYGSLITVLGILLILPVAESRSAWLAVAASSGFLYISRFRIAWKQPAWLNTKLKKTMTIASVVVLLTLALLGMYQLNKDSADGRLLIWKASLELIRENPLLGIGHDRFKAGYMEAQAGYFNENPTDPAIALADDVVYAFNEGIQLLVEQGIMGFVLVLVVVFFVLRIRGNNQSPEIWIAQAGLVSLLVFGMFSYPSHILPIKICGTLYLAILAGRSTILWEIKSSNSVRWIALSLMIFLSVTLLWRANKLYGALDYWKEAYTYYQRENYQSANQAYEQAYPTFSRDGDFLSNYGKSLSMAGEHVRAVVILEDASNYLNNTVVQTAMGDSYQALGMFTEAEEAYQLASDMLPDRFYPKYLLAKLYLQTGQLEKMKAVAQFLLEKEPKVPSQAVEEIKDEMRSLLN